MTNAQRRWLHALVLLRAMKNDQYFQVGDKVMLVDETQPPSCQDDNPVDDDEVDFGIVYVVAEFEEDTEYYNVISFVGQRPLFVLDGVTQGWPACCFRRIEEIKLCVRAAAKHRLPIEAMPKQNERLQRSAEGDVHKHD